MLGSTIPARRPEPRCAARERRTAPSAALPETGLYVSRSVAGDHLIIDAGRTAMATAVMHTRTRCR
jgi:hypothetical protein